MRRFADVHGTPRAPDDVSEAPLLSLQQHAWLCAELALDPANRSAILQHYGINEAQRRQLDAFWGTRMQIDDNLRAAWEELCTVHRTQLLANVHPKR